jgi:hypothetical protein
VRRDEALQLRQHVVAAGEPRLRPVLGRLLAQVVEPGRGRLELARDPDVGERRPPPLREGPVEVLDRRLRVAGAPRGPARLQRGLEAREVHGVRFHAQRPAGRRRHQRAVGAELPAQPRDEHLQRAVRARGRLAVPQRLDEPVGGHHAVVLEHQQGQQRPLATAGERPSAPRAARPTATTTPAATQAPPPWLGAEAIRVARPARPAAAVLFQPEIHLRIPRHWTAQEIDQAAFTVYDGDDELRSPGEIIFDGALVDRPLDAAVARLRRARGIRPGPLHSYRVGTATARGFDTPTLAGGASFADSGFHTRVGEHLRVLAFRGSGRTITVFIVTGRHAPTDAFRTAAMRVLRTVTTR